MYAFTNCMPTMRLRQRGPGSALNEEPAPSDGGTQDSKDSKDAWHEPCLLKMQPLFRRELCSIAFGDVKNMIIYSTPVKVGKLNLPVDQSGPIFALLSHERYLCRA